MADTESADFTSFTELDWKRQEEADQAALGALLNARPGEDEQYNFSRPLEIGEKADDAEDYEDISDDDLPEEEEGSGHNRAEVPALTDDGGTSNELDDLFGEDEADGLDAHQGEPSRTSDGLALPPPEPEPEFDLEYERRQNFPGYYTDSNQDPNIPEVAETQEDLVKSMWPNFEKGAILNWNTLMPPKLAHFLPKAPLKQPKPLFPTKVSLDIAPDQEKSFRSTTSSYLDKRKNVLEMETKGIVTIEEEESEEESEDYVFDYALPDPNERIGGATWSDLEIICHPWDINPPRPEAETVDVAEDEPMDEWEQEVLGHSAKRKRTTYEEPDYMNIPRFPVPNLDDFEAATAQIAKYVVLDLNDHQLLLDIQEYDPAPKRQKVTGRHFKQGGKGGISARLFTKYNISNDEAYEALKENHQSKIRATLGNITVEHSLPALKLQWPYYRVKLYTRDARAFHRPSLKFNKFLGQNIQFSKPGLRKKKSVKGLPIEEIFKESKDLSLGDHYSTATLLEYSEEHPVVLSNFGMGNRILNYYRRKDNEDEERPAPEDKIGDLTVLLPEDKSPFSNFGMVDPGETVRAIHNAMYRAPIFKHQAKNTDFLIIRNSTGIGGTNWHVRNIDHIFAVGQQFPSVEIPGPHSRKVTNAAKNRMKMIAFRKIKHNPQQHLKIGEITQHIADSTDMQNRQKLKEFINYDKTEKVWRMKQGEAVPDETSIRAMVKPEDVCLIDAMQVGSRHLEDAGYAAEDYDEDNDGATEGKALEQNLAPWHTTKAFIEASQDKAMLHLHGPGDPSGCGLAFSFIKTSMKGGYIGALQGPAATSEAAMIAERKANGGHTYNVKRQQTLYNEAIRDIWDKQKENLSDPTEHNENDLEEEQVDEDDRLMATQTPHSSATPAAFDDSASQFSTGELRSGRAMRITRTFTNKFGQTEEQTEIVQDVRVWREYQKRRYAIEAASMKYDGSLIRRLLRLIANTSVIVFMRQSLPVMLSLIGKKPFGMYSFHGLTLHAKRTPASRKNSLGWSGTRNVAMPVRRQRPLAHQRSTPAILARYPLLPLNPSRSQPAPRGSVQIAASKGISKRTKSCAPIIICTMSSTRELRRGLVATKPAHKA